MKDISLEFQGIQNFILYIFQVQDFEFVVINLHINGRRLAQTIGPAIQINSRETEDGSPSHKVSQLAPLVAALRERLVTERNIILLGDFGMNPDDDGKFILWTAVPLMIVAYNILQLNAFSCCFDYSY